MSGRTKHRFGRTPPADPEKRKRITQRPEQVLQIQAVRFIRAAAPWMTFFAIPNGGARTLVEAQIFKAMGVLPGVPDLFFLLPDGRAAFIELKAAKGALSASQVAMRDQLQADHALWAVARSLEDIAAILTGWLEPYGMTLKARLT